MFALALIAESTGDAIVNNTGGIATGGGLIALAVAAWPIAKEIIAYLKDRTEKKDAIQERIRQDELTVEKEKRLEDVAARVETAKMFREMVEAIVTSGNKMDGLEEQVRMMYMAVIGKENRTFAPLSPPPATPPSGEHHRPKV